MHGIIPYMFDLWTDPVVHLLQLEKSMPRYIRLSKYLILNQKLF